MSEDEVSTKIRESSKYYSKKFLIFDLLTNLYWVIPYIGDRHQHLQSLLSSLRFRLEKHEMLDLLPSDYNEHKYIHELMGANTANGEKKVEI